jgi:hypothetical protein
MNAIPIHVQRRFEQRWASRFALPVTATASKNVGTKSHNIKINGSPRRAAKTEEKPAGVKARRSAV